MKKILYTTMLVSAFIFAGQVNAAVYEQTAMEYQQYMVTDGGGGGGGGTTVYQQPTTTTNVNDTMMIYNPTTPTINEAVLGDYVLDTGSVTQTAVTATVSSCPSGTTMSSDKCCCVNN